MLQLLDWVILSGCIEEHGKFIAGRFDLVFKVDLRRSIEGIAQVVDIRQESVNDEASTGCEMIVGIFESIKLLLYFIKMHNRVKRQED